MTDVFKDCPYGMEAAAILTDAARPDAERHAILHRVSVLGRRLSGTHRDALVAAAYSVLDANRG
jgi:hypothetical protein